MDQPKPNSTSILESSQRIEKLLVELVEEQRRTNLLLEQTVKGICLTLATTPIQADEPKGKKKLIHNQRNKN